MTQRLFTWVSLWNTRRKCSNKQKISSQIWNISVIIKVTIPRYASQTRSKVYQTHQTTFFFFRWGCVFSSGFISLRGSQSARLIRGETNKAWNLGYHHLNRRRLACFYQVIEASPTQTLWVQVNALFRCLSALYVF